MERILVIDDDKNIRFTIAQLLGSEEVTVDSAADGEQGLALLENDRYSLVSLKWWT